MAEVINTIDVLGDDVVIDSIINRTIEEFRDNVITMVGPYAFNNCTNLGIVDLPNATYIGDYAFGKCPLSIINLPKVTEIRSNSFLDVGKLHPKVCFPILTRVNYEGFRGCSFTHIDLPVCTYLGSHAFYQAGPVQTLVLRSGVVCKLENGSNAFAGSSTGNTTQIARGNGYIYVPRALVDEYKAATNWSSLADQFRALEDYTVDGTTTGELDETKI